MKTETKVKIGILSIAMLSQSALGITPSFGAIATAFPEAGTSMVQMLSAVPSLIMMVSSLVFARIGNKVSKKSVAILGPALVLVGGMMPFFYSSSLVFMIFCAGILGLGAGFVMNITQILITTYMPENQRETVMGQNTAFVSIGAMFMTLVGGQLAANGYKNNYLVYLIAVAVLLIVFVTIPTDKVEKTAAVSNEEHSAEKKERLPLEVYIIAGIGLFFMLVYNTLPNNISMFIENNQIGGTEASGAANAIAFLGGLVAGLLLGRMIRFFQKESFAVAFVLAGVVMLLLAFTQNMVMVYVACFLIGGSLSIVYAQAPFVISISVAPQFAPAGIALFLGSAAVGGFISPFVVNAISSLVLDGSAKSNLLVGGMIGTVVCLILLVSRFQRKLLNRVGSCS